MKRRAPPIGPDERRQHHEFRVSTRPCRGDRHGRLRPGTAGDVARELARWAWAVVIVYLDHQSQAEATVAEIIAAGGTTIAVRADLADDLDVQRLFTESIAEFGGVDVVVHTTSDSAALLYQHAARHVRRRGAIVSTSAPEPHRAGGRIASCASAASPSAGPAASSAPVPRQVAAAERRLKPARARS